ncbi:beta-mannosidase [Paenibacillus phyllosphaerae]|uniref:beta-mannosidase n=1 Tax=Paenibacillus phyllosphaerae TaxID=274593 RepID=A0A7W5B3E9_9BACL|nr:glycoside hydrolase family 2 TIM barrel-domain containing protein [Paenibacillus phyllosphaerae]MBB3113707.1 beta-mannosidase [Paenibacillus phyllosphaerae]
MEKSERLGVWSLSAMRWELKGFWPWVPVKGTSMEIGSELMGVTDWIPATVPGGVHVDLFRAGLIDNPYRDMASTHCEWVENRWWVYRTVFPAPSLAGEAIELICQGLDYEALVYWNGQLLGEHRGMYEPAVFDVTDTFSPEETVELLIVLKQAPDEMGQIGKTSETFTQKSRFNYKWDFSTRLVNVGIWDDIALVARQRCSIEELSVTTDTEDGLGLVRLLVGVKAYGEARDSVSMAVDVTAPDGRIVASTQIDIALGESFRHTLVVEAPALWYPSGYGEQPLYTVKIRLEDQATGALLDSRQLRTGIRKLEYVQNVNSPADALPYTFVVNGRKIYIKGANLTPLDHMYGNVDPARYEWIVRMAKASHMNLLRIWGGGVIEKPYLYELCDEMGILIWQEFIQSSSGIDNEPSKKPAFLELLARNAVSALRERRNHVSLTVWSGGNELMSAPNVPSTYEDSNLAMLRGLALEHDPGRLFLPTSASGPVQYITEERGVSHDVHGHWKYMNNPDHYRIYGQADHLFHSEFGVDGLSGPKSIRKFLSPRYQQPVSMKQCTVWRHHGEWWDTYDRDTELFGELATLESFADCSQWIQAEGLRYILEANRRRKFENSGSIIWQLNEPWPNVSCTNLIDYYNEPKMAYYWVAEAFRSRRASLDYASLHARAGERQQLPVYVSTDGESADCTVGAEVLDSRGQRLHEQTFSGRTEADRTLFIGMLNLEVPHTVDGLYYVRLSLDVHGEGTRKQADLYLFSTEGKHVYASALNLRGGELTAVPADAWQDNGGGTFDRVYAVRNTGSEALLHVYPVEHTDLYWMKADQAYFTLFPGEERRVQVTCKRKAGELFAEPSGSDENRQPEIAFSYFQAAARQQEQLNKAGTCDDQ